jgi:hypothetical protein
MSSPNLRRFVHDTLTATTDVATPDALEVGAGYGVLCAALKARLHPVFGAVATSALFARAVHVTAAEFAWLPDLLPDVADTCSVEGLQRLAGTVEPRDVQAGLAAILARVIGLLSEFVGEDVVMPLVTEAWASPRRSEGPSKGGDQ